MLVAAVGVAVRRGRDGGARHPRLPALRAYAAAGTPPLVGRRPARAGRARARRPRLQARLAAPRATPTSPTWCCRCCWPIVAGLAATRLTAWLATWWTRRRPHDRSLQRLRVRPRDLAAPGGHAGDPAGDGRHRGRGVRGRGLRLGRRPGAAASRPPPRPAATTWTLAALAARDPRPDPRVDPDGDWLMAARPCSRTPAPASPSWTPTGWPRSRRGRDVVSPGRPVEEIADDSTTAGRRPAAGRPAPVDHRRQPGADVERRSTSRRGSGRSAACRSAATSVPFPRGREHAERRTLPARALTGCPLEGLTLGRRRRNDDGDGRLGPACSTSPSTASWWTTRSTGPAGRRPPTAGRGRSIADIDSAGDTIDLTFDSDGRIGDGAADLGRHPAGAARRRGVDVSDERRSRASTARAPSRSSPVGDGRGHALRRTGRPPRRLRLVRDRPAGLRQPLRHPRADEGRGPASRCPRR